MISKSSTNTHIGQCFLNVVVKIPHIETVIYKYYIKNTTHRKIHMHSNRKRNQAAVFENHCIKNCNYNSCRNLEIQKVILSWDFKNR